MSQTKKSPWELIIENLGWELKMFLIVSLMLLFVILPLFSMFLGGLI